MARAAGRDIGRLVRSEDFERVLRVAPRGTSAHFAIHHVGAMPSRSGKSCRRSVDPELSTSDVHNLTETVDDLRSSGEFGKLEPPIHHNPDSPTDIWLGLVVPKRHARRAVTRNLLRREIRAAVADRRASLPGGLWVVRLRAGFDRSRFQSAASDALRQAARRELASLVARCAAHSPVRPDPVQAERS